MENLCYFLETNFSDLCELFLYISIAGFIIYLPFRSHWGKNIQFFEFNDFLCLPCHSGYVYDECLPVR